MGKNDKKFWYQIYTECKYNAIICIFWANKKINLKLILFLFCYYYLCPPLYDEVEWIIIVQKRWKKWQTKQSAFLGKVWAIIYRYRLCMILSYCHTILSTVFQNVLPFYASWNLSKLCLFTKHRDMHASQFHI